MAGLTVYPGRLSGALCPPPSKSLAHRAVICAALAQGESVLEDVEPSQDILATVQGMRALGAELHWVEGGLRVRGRSVGGRSGLSEIDCNESGSTLRFLMPLVLALNGGGRFIGRGQLGKRPLTPYQTLCRRQGIAYQDLSEGGRLEVELAGWLRPERMELPGNVSSQFITGLLLALPLLPGDSEIALTTPLESEGYVALTLAVQEQFGVQVERPEPGLFRIPGGQRYRPACYRVEGDYSQAAFFLCADALGAQVRLMGMNPDSRQGDRQVLDILEEMGCRVHREQGMVWVSASRLTGTVIDAAQCPDIIPELALVAALSQGESRIKNAGRLRLKECDRLAAIARALNALGGRVRELEDGLVIEGVCQLEGGVAVSSCADHRMAMMLAVAAQSCRLKLTIDDATCVNKSYPGFWDDFRALGGLADEWHVGQ